MRKFLVILLVLSFVFVGISYAAKGKEAEKPVVTTPVPEVKNKVLSAFGDIKKVTTDKNGVVTITIADRSGNDVDVLLSELEKDATIVATYIKKDEKNVVKTLSIVKSAQAPKSKDILKQK